MQREVQQQRAPEQAAAGGGLEPRPRRSLNRRRSAARLHRSLGGRHAAQVEVDDLGVRGREAAASVRVVRRRGRSGSSSNARDCRCSRTGQARIAPAASTMEYPLFIDGSAASSGEMNPWDDPGRLRRARSAASRIRRQPRSPSRPISAALMALSEPIAETSFPDIFARISDGTASAARTPMTETVTSSSMSVKPCELENAARVGWPWG